MQRLDYEMASESPVKMQLQPPEKKQLDFDAKSSPVKKSSHSMVDKSSNSMCVSPVKHGSVDEVDSPELEQNKIDAKKTSDRIVRMLKLASQSNSLKLIQAANLVVFKTQDYSYFELLGKGGYGRVRRC